VALANETKFSDLIARVRSGDERAATELVRVYEPHVRRLIRIRLTDPGLKRQIDSVDVCQSVLASFFVRTALGQYDLQTPEQLIKLLATMARNKLVHQADKQHAARRDIRRVERASADELPGLAGGATPSRIVAGRELLAEVRNRLSPEERYLVEQRALGRSWDELAQELGRSADALRMRVTRALDVLARSLGLDEEPV
jgi:RNA polymerase sigma factor (sigma-70 family)